MSASEGEPATAGCPTCWGAGKLYRIPPRRDGATPAT